MKKVLLLCVLLLFVVMAKAQNIVLQNTSCQPITYVIFADPACGAVTYWSKPYTLSPGGGAKLSMFATGPYPQVLWTGPTPPPGSQYTVVKIIDPGSAWSNMLAAPCYGPSSFGPQPGCGAQGTSSGWSPTVTTVVSVY